MAEELQHLIDRIQKEAIDTAEKQAQEIVARAKQKAAQIIKEAEQKAKANLAKADRDAQAYTARSIKPLEQAARDLLITVGQGVENILSDLVAEAVEEAMGIELIEKVITKIAEACAAQSKDARIDRTRLDEVGILATPLEYHTPKLPGLGDVDWGRFFSVLGDAGYSGPVCIEVEDRVYEGSLESRKASLIQSGGYLQQFISDC